MPHLDIFLLDFSNLDLGCCNFVEYLWPVIFEVFTFSYSINLICQLLYLFFKLLFSFFLVFECLLHLLIHDVFEMAVVTGSKLSLEVSHKLNLGNESVVEVSILLIELIKFNQLV